LSQLEEYIRKVSTKGQVTIPAEIRQMLEIEPGDRVAFRVTDDAVELIATPMTLEQTFGAVTPQQQPEDFADLRDTAVEEHARRVVEEMKNS
jgi:antitoxin PrlF